MKVTLNHSNYDYQIKFGTMASDYAKNDANGHYYTYRYFLSNESKTWEHAKELANQMTYKGLKGYLITITSAEEQAFVQKLFKGQFWTAGTRDSSKYPKDSADTKIQGNIAKNKSTFGEAVESWASTYNGAWFWGDGPELGLIYFPYAISDSTTVGWNTQQDVDGNPLFEQQHDKTENVTAGLRDAFNKVWKNGETTTWTYSGTTDVVYNHWASDSNGPEPNDQGSAYTVTTTDGKTSVKETNPNSHERFMHVYADSYWNDYATGNTSIVGYLVEFGGQGEAEVNEEPQAAATAHISPALGKTITTVFTGTDADVVILPDGETHTPDVKRTDGTIPDDAITKVNGSDTKEIKEPGRYEVVTTFTEGDDSYYSIKYLDVVNLAGTVSCVDGYHTPENVNYPAVTKDMISRVDGTPEYSEFNIKYSSFIEKFNEVAADNLRPHTITNAAVEGTGADSTARIRLTLNKETKQWVGGSIKTSAEKWEKDKDGKDVHVSKEDWTPFPETSVNGNTITVPFEAKCIAKLTDVKKEIVRSEPTGVTLPEGVVFVYPEENKPIQLGSGENDKVTLLYKITVTGTKGAAYTVADEGAMFLTDTSGVLGDSQNDGENTSEGLFTDVLYAYRTFTRDDIVETNLVNKVELKAGDNTEVNDPDEPENPDPENPDDPKKTDEEEVPAQRKPDVAKTAYSDEDCTKEAESATKGDTLYYQIAIDTNGNADAGKKTSVKSFKVEDAFVVATDEEGKTKEIPIDLSKAVVKVGDKTVNAEYKSDGVFVLPEATTETIYVTYSYRIPYDSTFTNSSAVVNKATATVSTGNEPGPNDPSGEDTSSVSLGYTIKVQVVNGDSTLPDGIEWATGPEVKTEDGVPFTEGTISVKPGGDVSVNFAPKTEEGHTYILDSVKMNGKDPQASYTPVEGKFTYPFKNVRGNNTIRVEYALDDVGDPNDPDGKGPDGVPDKYQVKVTFLSKNGDLGPFKVKDAEGEFTANDLFTKTGKFSSLTVYVNLYKVENGEKKLAVDGENKLTTSPLLRTITEEAQKKAQEGGTVIPTVGNHSNLGYTKPGNWVDSYTDDKGVTTTYDSNPNDQTVRYKADGYTYCYVYSPDKATVTVNYLDNDVGADGNHKVLHAPYSEEFTVAGYDVTDETNVAIDHYIKDRVEIKSASGNAGLSVESGMLRPEPVIINVYYDLDNWHDGDKDPKDPTDHENGGDGIPDKYQARIVYQVTDGKGRVFTMGQYLAERVMEIVTIGDNATSGTVDIAGARAVPNVGEEFNIWTAADDTDASWKPDGVNLEQMWLGESFSKLGVEIDVVGKHTYTFTASFGASTTSYTVNFLDEEVNEDGTHDVLHEPETYPNQTPGFKIDRWSYKTVKIENYVFDHADPDSIVLKKGSDNTINLYYAKDKIHETEEPVVPPIPDPDPDKIPDKYQVTIQYDTDGDGKVDLEEVRTLRDSEGNLIDAGAVMITGAKAAPGEGFAFDYWTAKAVSGHDGWVAPSLDGVGAEELRNIPINVKGGAVYLFTANVAEDEIQKTEEPVPPTPGPKPDEIPDKYQVTIRYDTNGDNVIDLEEVKTIVVGGKYAEIGDITISGASAASVSGYHFTEWTASAEKDTTWGIQPQKDAQLGQLTISNAKGGEVYTFKANFAPNPSTPVTYYTVTYLDGGVPVGTQRDIAGRTVIVLPAPTAEGKTFTGWIGDDGRVYQPGDRIVLNSNKILTARWEDNTPDTPVPETFTVTWIDPLDPDNPVIKTVEVEKLDDAEYPEHPAHEGWRGNGWSEPEWDADGNCVIRAEYVPLDVDPDAPSYEYLRDTLGIMVRVECHSNATHAPMTYEVPLKENSYEARVTGDTCTLTIAPDLYVAEFNRMSGGEHGTADVVSQRIELVYVPAEIVPAALDDEFAVDENVFVEEAEIANEVVTPVIDETEAPEEPAISDVEAVEPAADDESVEGLPGDVEAAGYEVVSNAAAELGYWQLAEGQSEVVTFVVHCEAPVPDTIKVTFKDGLTDETIDERDVEEVPGPDEYPDAPTHDGYEFTGWTVGEPDADGNVTITANYRPVENPTPTITVTFVDGRTGNTIEVRPGLEEIPGEADYPDAPEHEGYEFTGWTVGTPDADGNVTITANYRSVERTHTVTWVNWNGATLDQRTDVPEGTDIPSSDFRGSTPTRPSDGTYTYTFTGWSVSVDTNGNVTYTAQYTPTLIYNPGTPSYPSYPSTPSTPSNPSTPSTNIPDTNPPLTDTPSGDGGTTITDQDVPLAGAVGLNDVDHFAYIIGYSDDTVRPLNNITRAEVATIFFRLMTDEYRTSNWATTNDFSDVAAGNWFNNAISTCANAGALNGYSDGSFRPNANITRAEFAAIAARFLSDEYTDDGTSDFSDTADHWAAKEIRLAAKAGWIQGSGNKFRPNDYITRAEVMTIVNRMLDRVPDKDHMLDTMKKWTDNPEDAWYYEAVQEATNEHAYERDELGVVETWTEILTARDWKALEEEWANANAR